MALSLVVVAALSGAGRTTALKALEDQCYQTIDNLPIHMVPALIDHIVATYDLTLNYAVGIDPRSLNPTPQAIELVQRIVKDSRIDLKVVFLDCATQKIQQRYNESRRPHPITAQNLAKAIESERALLLPLQQIAKVQLDTTELNVRHLRRILHHCFSNQREAKLKIQLLSFSYKKGVPKFADLVLDMRFLSNPFYDSELKHLNGISKKVQDYIKTDPRWPIVEFQLKEFLINAIVGYQEQDRFYLNIAFGCTGGQHRSVFACEYFYKILQELSYDCTYDHRDLDKEAM